MALITWSDSLSVDVPSLDRQHAKLVALLNSLHEAMQQGRGQAASDAILNELVTYTIQHFADEERLMKQHGYPDFTSHKKLHDEFSVRVRAILTAPPSVKSLSTLNMLTEWLRNHIQGTDRKYAPYLAAKKVA